MANGTPEPETGWMADVQRILALSLVWLLVFAAALLVMRLAWSATVEDIIDLAKTQLAAMVNMTLIALGFFFGNTIAKQRTDATQAATLERLTPTAPVPPSPPPPPTAPVPPWWAKFDEAEKTALVNAGTTDARVQAFITASQVGAATVDDLSYLVTKALITQARADEIAKG